MEFLAKSSGVPAKTNTPFEREQIYRSLLSDALPDSVLQSVGAGLRGSGVIGSAAFVEECERLTGRRLAPGRRGRPKLED